MTSSIASLDQLFVFYEEKVKVLYAEIEAYNNTIPIELLFEIHAAFDNLRRIYTSKSEIEECVQKAAVHLKKGSLNAFKLKFKYYCESYNVFMKNHKHHGLDSIDNGKFLENLNFNKKEIYKNAKDAMSKEASKEDSFDTWDKVSVLIDLFYKMRYESSNKLAWADDHIKKYYVNRTQSFFIGFFSGFVANIIFAYFYDIGVRICDLFITNRKL